VAVCGELASDVAAVPILLGLGVRELSVAPPAVPRVKAAVRDVDLGQARAVAREALACASAAEVRALAG
jgi:phosphocarrier protein FPr